VYGGKVTLGSKDLRVGSDKNYIKRTLSLSKNIIPAAKAVFRNCTDFAVSVNK
jgi:hypothetical protein